MDIKQEIVDSIQVMVDSAIKKVCPIITFGVVLSVAGKNKCIVKINNIDYKLSYYGKALPDLNQKYPVFVPFGKMNLAFILTSGIGGGGDIGIIIKGHYDTIEELTTAVPNPNVGDIYSVGIELPYDIYVWDNVHSEWVNNGALQGPKGDTGNGISSVRLISGTHEEGTLDTYQIVFTNGSTTTFEVYNGADGEAGNGIAEVNLISGTHAAGTFDTYQIVFDDGSKTNFNIYNGANGAKGDTGNGISSIQLISGTHAAGTLDTYQITFTDNSTFDFMVYNGADGLGSGDMLKSVYDEKSLGLDVYGYADGMLGKTTIFNADGSITETTSAWEKEITFNANGSIEELITYSDASWRKKVTVFNADGSITETVTEGS